MKITLYIKIHNVTGMKYFGKTTRYTPKTIDKYLGSGVYWKKHILKHGKEHVKTQWCCQFDSQDDCSDFAILFSDMFNIVESKEWANLLIENGVDGAPVGHPSFITDKQKVAEKISKASIKTWSDDSYRQRMSYIHSKLWTNERKAKQSAISKLLWTEERRIEHSKKMSGKLKGRPNKLKGVPKTKEHNLKNSLALRGVPKSEEHCRALSEAKKIRRVCRLCDRKEMAIITYSKWLLSVENTPQI